MYASSSPRAPSRAERHERAFAFSTCSSTAQCPLLRDPPQERFAPEPLLRACIRMTGNSDHLSEISSSDGRLKQRSTPLDSSRPPEHGGIFFFLLLMCSFGPRDLGPFGGGPLIATS